MDFFVRGRISEEDLQCLQSDDFYPPRFQVFFVSFKDNATLSDGKIAFNGATSDLEFDIHLNSQHSRNTTSPGRMFTLLDGISDGFPPQRQQQCQMYVKGLIVTHWVRGLLLA